MRAKNLRLILVAALLYAGSLSVAHAQWAVVDVSAISRLTQQIQQMQQQLTVARNQLTQAQRQLDSMSGGRGMERLLSGTVRNYFPRDWANLDAAVRGGGGYGALSGEIRS